MNVNDPAFQRYVSHVLKWEGTTSSDPRDPAASCYPGGVHTVKGVTFCTFLANAASLGISPVNHQRFLELTNQDIAQFVLLFMNKAEASILPTPIALSVTEAAWGSGPDRAVRHLQDALNAIHAPGSPLTVDGDIGPRTLAAAAGVAAKPLFDQYWIERKKYLDYLIANGYSQYAAGWYNRMKDFLEKFSPGGLSIALGLLIAAVILIGSISSAKAQ